MSATIQLVILTSEHDCDGVSYGAHRIDVPAGRAIPLWTDHEAALRFAIESEQMSGAYDCADDVMPVAEFLSRYSANMSVWARGYFDDAGFARATPSGAPRTCPRASVAQVRGSRDDPAS